MVMKCSDHVVKYVAGLVVDDTQRLSFGQAATLDDEDARHVENNIDDFKKRLIPIVKQLRTFSGKNFPIQFERNYRRGLAKPGGVISIDFATLKKPISELALTVAHEWGHQSMGHLTNNYCAHAAGIPIPEAERQADYYGGIFLGVHGYDIDEVLKIKLSMPETDPIHGTRFERACVIMQGFVHGKEMLGGKAHTPQWPGFEFPWLESKDKKPSGQEIQDSNLPKLFK